MQDRGSLPEVEDYDSRVSKGFNDSRSDGLRGLVAHFMNFLTFRNPEAIQPMQSSASSSKSLARGKQRDQQQLQAPSHGESAIIDMTREPDEDMLFLASPRRPDLPGSASSFSSTEGGSRRRREPMYNEVSEQRPYSLAIRLSMFL